MPLPLALVSTAPPGEQLARQIVWLFVLAIPIACVAWTITHEEIFREGREYCSERSKTCKRLLSRKAFYLVTCEYCFSHWITLLALLLTGYRLLLDGAMGYVIGFFALVFVANIYMSLYSRLRIDIRSERAAATVKEKHADVIAKQLEVAVPPSDVPTEN